MKTPVLEVEEGLKILKPLLHRCSSSLTLRNDLQDMGVYVMSRWILDFLMVCTIYMYVLPTQKILRKILGNFVCFVNLVDMICHLLLWCLIMSVMGQ
jgi:hypothetical protein